MFLIGFCAAAFGLARHSFMTTRVPLAFRARALSLLGGSFRLGMFVGPFIAAGLLAVFGTETAADLVLRRMPRRDGPARAARSGSRAADRRPSTGARRASIDAREDTGEAVTGSIPTAERGGRVPHDVAIPAGAVAARAGRGLPLRRSARARQVVLPLWGVSIGLDAQTIALVVGISGAIDFALFYASGQVMDRFGRLWAALPAMVLMGAGFLALAFTHDLSTAELWFGVFAAVLGVGNGLSSGILLTLGADVAPKADPAPFLGSWRTLTDAGGAASPLIVAAITAMSSLSVAVGAVGVLGFVGALAFVRWVPRFVPREIAR